VTPLAKLLEAALFASAVPVPADALRAIASHADDGETTLEAALEELRNHYDTDGHGVELIEVAGGWQILTRPEYTEAIERAQLASRPQRLSAAALETLAIIAYRQPIGRAEIEEIRGVGAGAILKSLGERGLIDIVGRVGASPSIWDDAVVPRALRTATPRGASARRRAGDRSPGASTGDSDIGCGYQGQRRRTFAGGLMPDSMRIQRALARAGIASRRRAEELVAAGRVRINGAIAETGQSVNPARDTITVDGKTIGAPPVLTWIVLNKPTGVLTTRNDPGGRRTVFDLVEDVPGLTYVGRLDYMTEGVLLLTTDGDAAHKLTHPSSEIERTYVATVRGEGADAARAAMKGVELEDGLVMPKDVAARRVGRGIWELDVTIAEGKTREIRRLCEALGLEVLRLVRTTFGPVKLGSLESGKTRPLTAREKEIISALTKSGGKVENSTRGARRERTRRYSR